MTFLKENFFSTNKWYVTGIVEAPLNEVFKILLETITQNVKPLLDLKSNFETNKSDINNYFVIDPHLNTITIRGGFWYEGIFSTTEIENQTRIMYRVNNIGPKSNIIPKISKWLVPIWQHKMPSKMRLELNDCLINIGKQLNCKTYIENN